jgi:hypothetical protein
MHEARVSPSAPSPGALHVCFVWRLFPPALPPPPLLLLLPPSEFVAQAARAFVPVRERARVVAHEQRRSVNQIKRQNNPQAIQYLSRMLT